MSVLLLSSLSYLIIIRTVSDKSTYVHPLNFIREYFYRLTGIYYYIHFYIVYRIHMQSVDKVFVRFIFNKAKVYDFTTR